jgi:hypothetical protein
MTGASIGMIYDRALTPELLDVGLRVATKSGTSPDARRLLTVALRDHVSDQEAQGKTKKCLSRIWLQPPRAARPMIAWAVDHQQLDPTHTVIHLGALIATFPFAAAVTTIVGRHLQLDGQLDPRTVKAETRLRFGDRSTIDVGARKVLTTLRYLGLLAGPDGGPYRQGDQPVVPAELTAWITHAVLLARQATAVGTEEAARAPELALLKVPSGWSYDYPLLELHSEASRTVAVTSVC